MQDLSHWPEQNRKFREAAVRWIRLRMQRLAHCRAPKVERPWWQMGERHGSLVRHVHEREIQHAYELMEKAAEIDPPPALLLLERRFGLSLLERHVLLLCAAVEMSPGLAELCAIIQGDRTRTYPTFGMTMELFDDADWGILSPERPLRRWRLIEIAQPATPALTSSVLTPDERVFAFILGLNYLDHRLAPLLLPMETVEMDALPPSSREQAVRIVQRIQHERGSSRLSAVQLVGPDNETKDQVAAAACQAMGMTLYQLPV
jgi:hypothetical protein